MTVERTKSASFPVNQPLVMNTIEQILREHGLYRQTSVNRDTSTVTTTITPGFPLLSTKMTVQLRTVADQTLVRVTTRSHTNSASTLVIPTSLRVAVWRGKK